ncbi:MAG TPA: TPM domain-containing protein, partial [Vicinamibacteria bacterium]|nr:TPM domain-containing protein [Vicinamibacteria bacterium]
ERDDGVLLFVARADRRMRLEIGYGLEDRLTDLRSRRILDEVIGPRFKAGDFGGGIEEGVKAVETVIRGGEVVAAVPPAPVAPAAGELTLGARLVMGAIFLVVVGLFSGLALVMPGGVAWTMYAFLMPFHCVFPMAILTPPGGLAWLALWVIGFPLARAWAKRKGWAMKMPAFSGGRSGWTSGGSSGGLWGSSGGSSWSSSSSSGGGFSGGGGSFGGGGASSSW